MPLTPQRKDHLDALAMTLLVVCCAVWGFQQILIKITVAEVPPLWQASLRVWGAATLLWLWCRARGVPLFSRDGTLRASVPEDQVAAIQAVAGIQCFAHLRINGQASVVGPGVVAAHDIHVFPAVDIDAHVECQSSGA